MSEVYAIIGSGYGDEGKGLVTDFLSSSDTKVVRFNGGGQAAHTVCTPEGKQHVFHHIGSGSFKGAETYLGSKFVVNPIIALEEFQKFDNIKVNLHTDSCVTLPQDIMINQVLETKRGDSRHGSCGIGFGETIERNDDIHLQFPMTSNQLSNHEFIKWYLDDVNEWWVPYRCGYLGIDHNELPYTDEIGDRFIEDCLELSKRVNLIDNYDSLKDSRVIFEGAQGLGLDQCLGDFPYVTRSYTGLPNIMDIVNQIKIRYIDVIYITRAYSSRHGPGPLDSECQYIKDRDPSNPSNQWQGQMRYAPLEIKNIKTRIYMDMDRIYKEDIIIKPHLFITCLDQIESISHNDHYSYSREISDRIDINLIGYSTGRTRNDVTFFNRKNIKMNELLESIIGYKFPNKELRVSFALFILTIVMGTIISTVGGTILVVPMIGSIILCIVFLIAGLFSL